MSWIMCGRLKIAWAKGRRRLAANRNMIALNIEFSGEIWYWRGPAPHHFVTVPESDCHTLKALSRSVTYGWGMIPVRVRIGKTEWKTSLFPKDGRYIVPIKASVQKAEHIGAGDTVTVRLEVG